MDVVTLLLALALIAALAGFPVGTTSVIGPTVSAVGTCCCPPYPLGTAYEQDTCCPGTGTSLGIPSVLILTLTPLNQWTTDCLNTGNVFSVFLTYTPVTNDWRGSAYVGHPPFPYGGQPTTFVMGKCILLSGDFYNLSWHMPDGATDPGGANLALLSCSPFDAVGNYSDANQNLFCGGGVDVRFEVMTTS